MQRMITKSTILGGVLLMLLVVTSQTMSQQRGDENNARQGDNQQRRRFDPEAMRQRMSQWMKDQLEVDDEAWTVIGPRVEKVSVLNWQLMGRPFGRGGRRGGGGPGPGDGAELSALDQARQELRTLLEQPEPASDEIKVKLEAMRKAKQATRQQLIVAQQELRELLTLKQEAQLVMIGILE